MSKPFKILPIVLLSVLVAFQLGLPVLAQPSYNQASGIYTDDFSDTSGISSLDKTEHNAPATRVELAPGINTFTEDFTTETYKDAVNTTADWDTSGTKVNLARGLNATTQISGFEYGGITYTDNLNSVYFTDSNNGWAVADCAIFCTDWAYAPILHTTDGGANWSIQNSNWAQQSLNSVFFIDSNTGWAVGGEIGSFVVRYTVNGGTNWLEGVSVDGVDYPLNSVFFTDSNLGFAVGIGEWDSVIVYSEDGGLNWWLVANVAADLYSVHFTDSNTGWAVGGSGYIIKIGDGAQTSGTSENLRSVFFTDSNTGWTVGDSGTILKTTDGGTNWSSQTSGTSDNLNSVFFVDSNTGGAVGSSGTIIYTTDGGSTWSAQTSGTSKHLYSVNFTDSNTGWAAGEDGTILKLEPVYQSPKIAQSTNVNTTGFSIAKATLNATQELNGQSIDYYLSADGGTNWEAVTPGLEHSFSNSGSDLRWKAVLETTDPSTTPIIDDLVIDYRFDSATYDKSFSEDFDTNVYKDTPSTTAIWDTTQGLVRLPSEFQVNTYTTSNQSNPAIAIDSDGDFVITWGSSGQGFSIYAQRYNSLGVAQGSEFKVNTYDTDGDYQDNPAIAMDSDGDFVIVWHSDDIDDPDRDGIYAQRYNSSGVAQGSEFQVNTYTTRDQINPAIAMDSDGDFVITWQSYEQEGVGLSYGVYAQRYNSSGTPQGSEFQVNTYTASSQDSPAIAMDADGDFVITWTSNGQDGSDRGIYAQRYNSSGVAQGSEFQVNTYTTSYQRNSSIAMDSDGDFVITWESYWVLSDSRIFAQRYNSSGTPLGSEFQVNTYTTSHQLNPAIAMDSDGDFVITWRSNGQDGSNYGVYAQRYNSSGVAQGSEFQVNTYTTSYQQFPAIAMDADGDFAITWESNGQDGSGYGIYAQRHNAQGIPLYFSPEAAQSVKISTLKISQGELSPTQILNDQTIEYYMSADGGVSWEEVTLGETLNFPNPGTDLRWKAEIVTSDPSFSPTINELNIDYTLANYSASGTVLSQPITPSELGSWAYLDIDQTVEAGQDIYYQVLDRNGILLPDSKLPGNSSGLRPSSSIDISSINAQVYPSLILKAVLSTTDSTKTPTINSYSVSWIAARISLEKTEYSTDEEILFDGRESIGTDLSYFWEFGDESTAQGATAYHKYEEPGDYTVGLTVTKGTQTAVHKEEIEVKIVSGNPASLDLTCDPCELLANGTSQSTLTAQVKDQYDNLVEDGTEVFFEISQGDGDLSATSAETENGTASIIYTSSTNPGTVKIKATSDSISDEVEITLIESLISLTKSVRIEHQIGLIGAAVFSFFTFPTWLLFIGFIFFIILFFRRRSQPRADSPRVKSSYPDGKIISLIILFALAFIACLSILTLKKATGFNDEGNTVKPGDTLTYKIEYQNTSSTEAEEVVVIDSIPSGSSYLANSLNINGVSKTDALDSDEADFGQSNFNATTFNLGTVAKNASGYVTFQVKVNDPKEVEKIEDQAQANFSPGEFTIFSNTVSNPVEEEALPPVSPKGSIGNLVFEDENADGIWDEGEPGIAEIILKLYQDTDHNTNLSHTLDKFVTSTTTNSQGNYSFQGLSLGSYIVDVDETSLPTGYELTTNNEPLYLELEEGQSYLEADFGYTEEVEEVLPPKPIPAKKAPPPETKPPVVEKTFYQRYILENRPLQIAVRIVVAPIITATLVGITALTIITTSIAFGPYLVYLWQFLGSPLAYFSRKRRKAWGTVYNSLTKQPVDLAMVRLWDTKTKKLLQTRVTGRDGRYMFLVDSKKEYYLSVAKPDYQFPSRILEGAEKDTIYSDLYYHELITIKPELTAIKREEGRITLPQEVINVNIPLDPKSNTVFAPGLSYGQKTKINHISDLLGLSQKERVEEDQAIIASYKRATRRRIISNLGPVLGFVCFILSPSLYTVLLFVVQLLACFLFRRLALSYKPKPWGKVEEEETKKGLGLAVLRLFDRKYGRLLLTQVTPANGKYGFLVGKENYILTCEREGYSWPEKQTEILGTKEGIVRKDVEMRKKV